MSRRVALFAALTLLLGGCSSHNSSEPEATTGTLSKETADQPFVRDVTALRDALTSGQADESVSGIYDLLERATNEKDPNVGARMIRRDLPGLVATLTASAPAAGDRVRAVKLETSPGEDLRALDFALIGDEASTFQAFQADLDRTPFPATWLALARWGRRNNAMTKRYGAGLDKMLRRLSPEDRAAVLKAYQEATGNPPPK
jgi:hypothetical protein